MSDEVKYVCRSTQGMESRFLALMRFGDLAVPRHTQFMDSAVENTVQHILIVHDDALGMFPDELKALLLNFFLSHGVEIHEQQARVEILWESESIGVPVCIDIPDGGNRAGGECRSP